MPNDEKPLPKTTEILVTVVFGVIDTLSKLKALRARLVMARREKQDQPK